jgi:hypothetical protein
VEYKEGLRGRWRFALVWVVLWNGGGWGDGVLTVESISRLRGSYGAVRGFVREGLGTVVGRSVLLMKWHGNVQCSDDLV